MHATIEKACCIDNKNTCDFVLFRHIIFFIHAVSKLETEVTAPNSTICYNIPETNTCINSLNFIWGLESGQSCRCPTQNSTVGRSIFNSCGCKPDDNPSLMTNGSVCFSELTIDMNETLVHFSCVTDPCTQSDCFINTILSSNRIVIAGKTNILMTLCIIITKKEG